MKKILSLNRKLNYCIKEPKNPGEEMVLNSVVRHLPARVDMVPPDFLTIAPELIDVIGQDGFVGVFSSFLTHLTGAGNFEFLVLEGNGLKTFSDGSGAGELSVPITEMQIYEIRRLLRKTTPFETKVYVSGQEIPKGTDAINHQRILICSRGETLSHCLKLRRSPDCGPLSRDQIGLIRRSARIAMSMIVRHSRIVDQQTRIAPPLTSLEQIETCIATADALTRRETQVCARILFGLFTTGIALDLGIGKESVMTYRKRAYQRLNIGSQRELLMWYLTRWSDLNVAQAGTQADTAVTVNGD